MIFVVQSPHFLPFIHLFAKSFLICSFFKRKIFRNQMKKKPIEEPKEIRNCTRTCDPQHKRNHLNTKKNVTLKPKFVKLHIYFFLFHNNFFSLANWQHPEFLCPNRLKKKKENILFFARRSWKALVFFLDKQIWW